MIGVVALAACGAPPPPPPPHGTALPTAPGAPAAGGVSLVPVGELAGLCDASAAVWVAHRYLVVADDEVNTLFVFTRELSPVSTIALSALDPAFGVEEADLEGMTTTDDGTVWVVGSHDPGKDTVPKPDRQRWFSLRFAVTDGGLTATLAGPVDTSAAVVAPVVAGTEGRTAKDTLGLSIEGLRWRDGAAEIGFRAPVREGRAPLVRVGPGGPTVSWLDLGGRGIRSMEGPFVLAGGKGDFALFRTDRGTAAEPVPVDFGDWTPEGLVQLDDGWYVLSDDGRRDRGGLECRKLPPAQRRARVGRLEGL